MSERPDIDASEELYINSIQHAGARQQPINTFSKHQRTTSPEEGPVPISPACDAWARGFLCVVSGQLSYAEVLLVLDTLGLEVPPIPEELRSIACSRT